MGDTEAAASLFCSADSSSDLFTTLGTESSQEASGSLFDGASTDKPAINAFYSIPEQRASASELSETNQPAAVENYTYVSTHDESAPHGTYNSHQQWNYGAVAGALNDTSYDANKYASHTTHDPYVNNPYVPSPKHQPPAPQATDMLSYTGNQASTYDGCHVADSYAHQHAHQSAYTPYDPYTQMSSSKTVPTSQQLNVIPPVPSHNPHAPAATVSVPSAPMTTQISRPKVSNAYDPPFSAVSYSRRNVPGPAKYGQGYATLPHSVYATHQPTTSPPLASPPSRAPAAPPIPSIPPSPTVSHPPPPPPSKLHDGTHIPPPVQDHTLTHGALSSSVEPSAYASATHSSVPLASAVLSESTRSQNEGEDFLTNDVKEHALADESSLNFFDETNQEIFEEPGSRSIVDEPTEIQSARFRAVSPSQATMNRPHISTKPQSPGVPISSSLQQSFRAISPPRANMDSGRVSSPRQSPRPPSSPVHGVSHSGPRASPDLRRESLIREYVPRSKTTSPGTSIVNPYVPPPRGSALREKSASMNSSDVIHSPESSSSILHDRYVPRRSKVNNVYESERVGSPSSFSSRSSDNGQHNAQSNHLLPLSESPYIPAAFSQGFVPTAEDHHVPSQPKIKPAPLSGDFGQSKYGYSAGILPSQEAIIKPTITPYAPSPSLMGANDPLRRTSVCVPVISFGFGGKIVTCFHHTNLLNTGFDVALSPRTPTKVQIQSWKKLVPESALDPFMVFPGPLHADPGPPSTGIMKTGATAQAKMKRTSLVKYLSDRADEMTQGLGYLHNGVAEKRTTEGRLVLVKLLRIMVENDGRLLGTPQLDSAVRAALVPGLEASDTGTYFTTTADTLTETPFGAASVNGDVTPISVTTLRGAALDKIEEFLLHGERRQAYHYALDEKLWAHAMVIASSIDKEAWKEVVNEFIRADLGVKCDDSFTLHGRTDSQALAVNGREGLRVAYSLFSGQGAAAVQELVPKDILARGISRVAIPAPTLGQSTPRTPNLALPVAGAKIPTESLARWAETVAMLLVSPLTPDTSAALTSLGDQLLANGWLEAAHVCFLLSPQTSPVGGVGNPAARIVLLGSKNPVHTPTFSKDPDTIIFTEILEYIMTTVLVSKGQEQNNGFPHLQAYRLIRAYAAAEAGGLSIANRYCEAITASLVRGSVYFTPTMLEQLKHLTDRLSGVSHSDKANSWIPGKISKPSLDTFGGWLEGRFTKLVTGESDGSALPQEDAVKQGGGHGPFTHYNTISSATNSTRSSPAPSFVTPAHALPPRTGSAMSNKTSYVYGSATDLVKRKRSPGPAAPVSPAVMPTSATLPSFPSIQAQLGNHHNGSINEYSPGLELQTPKRSVNHDTDYAGDEVTAQEVTWWGSSGGGHHNNNNGKTPTAAKFEKVEEMHSGVDNEGFFSPMMSSSFVIGSTSVGTQASRPGQAASYVEQDEEDDLGLGNSTKKEEAVKSESGGEKDKVSAAPVEARKSDAPESNSGWFSRWWSRKENTSGGPVKANLGEESSFYYDKELKRWINKKAEGEAPKTPPPPPPPPRAQTASPGMSVGHEISSTTSITAVPPPLPLASSSSSSLNVTNGHRLGRPGSAVDLTTSPPAPAGKVLMHVRSNLAPPGLDSAPPTPMGTRSVAGTGPPPPTRPKSSSSQKRNVRSRYVDVFAAEGGGSGGVGH